MNAPMNPNKALWEKGNFTRIAESMRESGEALVQRLGMSNGLKVLDLGCGDGTTAIPEAKRGAEVLGVDIAANLVAAGNKRAKELGLANCRFQEGDASDMQGVQDRSFDLLVSIFGAMFAPKPFVDRFRRDYGPTMNAFEAAEKSGRVADLQRQLEDLFKAQNKSSRKDMTSIPATFLRVTVAL